MADFGNEGLAELYRRPGSASTVYVDVTQVREDPRRTSSLRHRSVREALADAEPYAVRAAELVREALEGVC